MKKHITLPTIVSSMILLIAIFPIKYYEFYILLRCIVFASAIYVAYFAYVKKKMNWLWLMCIISIIFNPFRSIHLNKSIWQVIDFMTAIVFLGSYFIFKGKKENEI